MKGLYRRTGKPQDDIPEEVWMLHLLKAFRKNMNDLEQLKAYAHGLEEENMKLQKQMEEVVENGPRVFEENKQLRQTIMNQSAVPKLLGESKYFRSMYNMLHRHIDMLEWLLNEYCIDFKPLEIPESHPLKDVNIDDLEQQMLQEWNRILDRVNRKLPLDESEEPQEE